MDGRGIAGAMRLGAIGAQLGTAFVLCDESAADAAYRAAMVSEAAYHTVLTPAISGRPARCLANEFTRWAQTARQMPPDYPRAYDIGKALNAAAKAAGVGSYGAQWAGQGAPLARALPATEIVAALAAELCPASGSGSGSSAGSAQQALCRGIEQRSEMHARAPV